MRGSHKAERKLGLEISWAQWESRADWMCKQSPEASALQGFFCAKIYQVSWSSPSQSYWVWGRQWFDIGPEHVQTHQVSVSGDFDFSQADQKDCARGSPLKTRYSGHQYSRLMRDMTKHTQTAAHSYYMREGWEGIKEKLSRVRVVEAVKCFISIAMLEQLFSMSV